MIFEEIHLKLGLALNFSLETCLLHIGLKKRLGFVKEFADCCQIINGTKVQVRSYSNVEEWRQKCQYVRLINKLTAKKKGLIDQGKQWRSSNPELGKIY